MNALVQFDGVASAEMTPMRRARKLRDLLTGLVAEDVVARLPEIEITDITLDSRAATVGSAFIAMPGLRTHGAMHAASAQANGAAIVLYEPSASLNVAALANVRAIAIPELSRLLGALANRFFESPSEKLTIAAVTGTNGKTTSAYLLAQACEFLGRGAGYLGTLGQGRPYALQSGTHTTPDVVTVHRRLANLLDDGAQAIGMEVSSHALHQDRVNAVRIDTAMFTNLTRDHLDYHGTFAAYGEAKALLFARPEVRHRVINVADDFGRRLAYMHADAKTLTLHGRDADQLARQLNCNYVMSVKHVHGAQGLELELASSWGKSVLRSRLIGDFNAENLLGVLAVLLGWNIPLDEAVRALERCSAPPGRMETFARPQRPLIVVDYAHTPDALEKALLATRAHCSGRLVCVFGCGGDRDSGKRPQMGAIAERHADRVIVTDDNPRSENPTHIVRDILTGMTQPSAAIVEHDRMHAIEQAILSASAQDAVLIAGKGHEDYQIVGAETRHFSDREVVVGVLGRLA